MTLSFSDLTKAQQTAVWWLKRYHGIVKTEPIPAGQTLTMFGQNTGGKLRSSFVWRSTANALITRGWLVMRGPDEWELRPEARAAIEAAWIETNGFSEEVVT